MPHGAQVLLAGDQRASLHEIQLEVWVRVYHEDVEAICGRLRSRTGGGEVPWIAEGPRAWQPEAEAEAWTLGGADLSGEQAHTR